MEIGETIAVRMLKTANGCLVPLSPTEEDKEKEKCVTVFGEVSEIDDGMIFVKYYCEKCSSFFTMATMAEPLTSDL